MDMDFLTDPHIAHPFKQTEAAVDEAENWEARKRNALQQRDIKTNQVDKPIRKKRNPTWWVMSCTFLSCHKEHRCDGGVDPIVANT